MPARVLRPPVRRGGHPKEVQIKRIFERAEQVAGKADNRQPESDVGGRGHHALVGQPHGDDQGPIADAERRAAQLRSC
jgi:hypothetical protein